MSEPYDPILDPIADALGNIAGIIATAGVIVLSVALSQTLSYQISPEYYLDQQREAEAEKAAQDDRQSIRSRYVAPSRTTGKVVKSIRMSGTEMLVEFTDGTILGAGAEHHGKGSSTLSINQR